MPFLWLVKTATLVDKKIFVAKTSLAKYHKVTLCNFGIATSLFVPRKYVNIHDKHA